MTTIMEAKRPEKILAVDHLIAKQVESLFWEDDIDLAAMGKKQ